MITLRRSLGEPVSYQGGLAIQVWGRHGGQGCQPLDKTKFTEKVTN